MSNVQLLTVFLAVHTIWCEFSSLQNVFFAELLAMICWYSLKSLQSLKTVTESDREKAKLLQEKTEDIENLQRESSVC